MDAPVIALKSFKYPGVLGANELVAGGAFTNAGGVSANYIARWDQPFQAFPPPAWEAMGPGFDNQVYAIERFNSATYAGGIFLSSNGTALNRIARFNDTTKHWEALGTGMNGTVNALKVYGSYLYAGGSFTTANGVPTGGLARWDGTAWSQVGGTFAGTVYALEIHNGQLVIGGVYPGINSSPNLAQYNGSTYSTFSTGGTNAAVRALYSTGSRLYVGGDFSTIGGVPASHIGYWDGAWHALNGGTNGSVDAFSGYHNTLDVGGVFTAVRSAALVTSSWAFFDETGVPQFRSNPFSQSATVGDNVSLTALPDTGYSGLTLRWLHNGAPVANGPTGSGSTLSGATTEILNITNIQVSDFGNYALTVTNGCGNDTSTTAVLTQIIVGVGDPRASAAVVFDRLGPNPSGGSTRLDFSLAQAARVKFVVHDVSGRLIRTVDPGLKAAGRNQATWDSRGEDGLAVRSGLYFVGLEVDGRTIGVKRLMVVR